MLKVIEVATLIGVSKVTVYKKISALHKELKPYIHKKRNITYIDDLGVEIIRASLSNQVPVLEQQPLSQQVVSKETSESDFEQDERVYKLENELVHKNRQIHELLERINALENEHLKDLSFLASVLEAQTAIKRREIDDKITILNGYKDIIGYNKERIRKIEESAYNLFK